MTFYFRLKAKFKLLNYFLLIKKLFRQFIKLKSRNYILASLSRISAKCKIKKAKFVNCNLIIATAVKMVEKSEKSKEVCKNVRSR